MKNLNWGEFTFVVGILCGTTACTSGGNTLQSLSLQQIAAQPQTVTVKVSSYFPVTGHNYSNFFVSNFSVKAAQGVLSLSTSRDGLPDTLKSSLQGTYGFGTTSAYTATSYFSDLLLYLSGIGVAQQPNLFCASQSQQSSSNDAFVYTDNRTSPPTTQFLGLRDCEKQYLGLNPTLFDFDGDGIPDYLELRCGLNPKNANDATLSIAGDGVSNIEKCRRHIAVDESAASQPNQLFAYQYLVENQTDGSKTFTVSNIPVLNGGQDNFLAFYMTETIPTTQQSYIYTAYAILKAGSAGQTLSFPYWATAPSKYFNQEIIF